MPIQASLRRSVSGVVIKAVCTMCCKDLAVKWAKLTSSAVCVQLLAGLPGLYMGEELALCFSELNERLGTGPQADLHACC